MSDQSSNPDDPDNDALFGIERLTEGNEGGGTPGRPGRFDPLGWFRGRQSRPPQPGADPPTAQATPTTTDPQVDIDWPAGDGDEPATSELEGASESFEAPTPIDWYERHAGVGARFSTPNHALNFLATLVSQRLAEVGDLRRAPDGGSWIAARGPWGRVAQVVLRDSGALYFENADVYTRVRPGLVSDPEAGPEDERVDPRRWPKEEPAGLIARVGLHAAELPRGVGEIRVVAPMLLARAILRRVLAMPVAAECRLARRTKLDGGQESGDSVAVLTLIHRNHASGFTRGFLESIADLPQVMVCRALGEARAGQGQLLVDLALRTPFAASYVSGLVPDDEIWLIGASDEGVWRLEPTGPSVSAHDLFAPATAVAMQAPPAQLPQLGLPSFPIRIARRAGAGSRRIEAVLLDDVDLAALVPFFMARALAETAFIVCGSGRHLILEAGGLANRLPFGDPLWRPGPGALFVEVEHDFDPPLTTTAREHNFPPSGDVAYVMAADESYRFDLKAALPVWALWLDDAPKFAVNLSPDAQALLDMVKAKLSRNRIDLAHRPMVQTSGARRSKSELLSDARTAYARGEVVEAAELLAEAGEFAQAARYFREAAENERD